MKIFNFVFLLLFSSFLTCCSDDETEDFRFDAESLVQTIWEGTELVTDGDKVISSENIEMRFFTTNSARCFIKEEGKETLVRDFKYSINDKLMKIEDGPLWNTWFIIEAKKDKLVLETMSSYKVTLTLYKKY